METSSFDEFVERFHIENGPQLAIFLGYQEDTGIKTQMSQSALDCTFSKRVLTSCSKGAHFSREMPFDESGAE